MLSGYFADDTADNKGQDEKEGAMVGDEKGVEGAEKNTEARDADGGPNKTETGKMSISKGSLHIKVNLDGKNFVIFHATICV